MISPDNLSPPSSTDSANPIFSTLPLPESATAYELAWRCCEDYQNQEKPLPSWTAIRSLIGKGSANDINRAKQDFVEAQLRIARKTRLGGEDLPERLKSLFQQFWQTAIDQAESNLAGRFSELQHQMEHALSKASHLEYDNQLLLERVKTAESEQLIMAHSLQEAHIQINSERLAKEGIEQKLTDYIDNLVQQKEDLQATLDKSTVEVKKALDRLEAMETRSLLEIDKVKTDCKRDLDSKDAKIRSLNAEYNITMAKEKQRFDRLFSDFSSFKERFITMEIENKSYEDKLHKQSILYDRLYDHFQSQQTTLQLIAEENKQKLNRKKNK